MLRRLLGFARGASLLGSTEGAGDDPQMRPIAGAQQPRQPTFTIWVKVIEGGCHEQDIADNVIDLLLGAPSAVAVEDCRVRAVVVESSIIGLGLVAVRARYTVIVTYRDAAGDFHVIQGTFAFPPDTDPPKIVSLGGADPDVHQLVVELTAVCRLTFIENNGRSIRVCVQLDWVIKFGQHLQLVVEATEAPETPKCTTVETECPEPEDPLLLSARKRRSP